MIAQEPSIFASSYVRLGYGVRSAVFITPQLLAVLFCLFTFCELEEISTFVYIFVLGVCKASAATTLREVIVMPQCP